MTNNSLLKKLTEYNRKHTPMHMPGHKRNTRLLGDSLPYGIDITEIDGFDNLHDMSGVLKDTADLAARLYGSKAAFPLVNGSTCGILAGIYAAAEKGSHILIARNCHKSVYNAIELLELFPHYIFPENEKLGISGIVSPESVKKALEETPEISLVVITSPTYEGVLSDLENTYKVCKSHGVTLLVDAAHGAHFGISEKAFSQKLVPFADLVVMSLHKTLPSLTQTALLHICSDRVSEDKIKDALSVFETSSPSYVLLSSVDECLHFCIKNKESFFKLDKNLKKFYKKAEKLSNLKAFSFDDLTKIIISTENTNITGVHLADILRHDFNIEIEMAQKNYVLAMTTVCDTKKSLNRLLSALIKIDKTLSKNFKFTKENIKSSAEIIDIPSVAKNKDGIFISLDSAENHESLEYVWCYPPGIPLVCPGEKINQELINRIKDLQNSHIEIKSTKGLKNNNILVAKD